MTHNPGFSVPLFRLGSYADARQGPHLLKHTHRAVKGKYVPGCLKCEALKISISRYPSPSLPPENQESE